MKTYKIFLKKTNENVVEDLILIKDGFNLFACVFQVFYLLYKQMWLFSFCLFAIFMFLNILHSLNFINVYFLAGLNLFLYLYIGFEFTDLFSKHLVSKGYEYLGYSSGMGEKEAKLNFLNHINENSDNLEVIKIF